MRNYIFLSVLFPFIGFLINGLLGRKIKNETIVGAIGAGAIGLSFLVVLASFIETALLPAEGRQLVVPLFSWISVGMLQLNIAYQVDQLSLLMSLVVTGIGFIIHIYSIGYMHGDKGFWRFFAYLNLFIFAMMNLVLADNFVLLFLGWEGVGLCSYLLIGFWYERKFEKSTTSDAAKKAFVVNRIGDFGFLVGMFLIYLNFNSLNFNEVFTRAGLVGNIPESTFNIIALCLFIGAAGKSAQIPLFVWLPDAMAGPTPVSALIHAATMVTAGVYMVARCSVLYASAPTAMLVVAIIGLLTAFFAATVGLVQNDIKKVLAYSTVSQLGYMFLALGMGAFTAGIFHVVTHAFFKALLFLGAGSVIHGMHDEQNIQKYGGLRKYMPKTKTTFLIGAIAISGIPPFAGFFSKDEILWNTYTGGGVVFWAVGALTAMMTAFYMFRLYILTFEGKERFDHHHVHPHESPKVMTVPLQILAVLSIIGGFIGIPKVMAGEHGNLLETWLEPVFKLAQTHLRHNGSEHSHFVEIFLMVVSVVIAVASILLARYIYLNKTEIADTTTRKFRGIYRILFNKYYVDEIYDAAVIKPILKTSETVLWKFTDVGIIDGLINRSAKLIDQVSVIVKKMQTGVAQFYAIIMAGGIALALLWLINYMNHL
ncbi:MAG: NADH-quinone oxidoreductase subunit L [Ignavibacteriales bacterium]|nr:NADH-quinone oxidoreductase subunit L [Ignavibacteriales bacterium]